MNQINYLILSIFTYILEGLILLMYCEKVFHSAHSLRHRTSVIFLSYFICALTGIFQNTYVNTAAFLISTFIIIFSMYSYNFKVTCIHTFIITLAMISTELIVFTFIPDYGTNIYSYVDEFSIYLMYYLLSKLLYFFVLFIASHIATKIDSTNSGFTLDTKQFLLLFGMIALFCLIAIILLNIMISLPLRGLLYALILTCSIAMILFALLITELYYYIEKQNSEKYELQTQLLIEQELVSSRNSIIKQDEEQKILIHDIKKHLAIINSMCTSNDTAHISEYINTILNSNSLHTNHVVSDNALLNAIANRYITNCEADGISMRTDIRTKVCEFMSDYDMTSLFCNLLDNSVEAARKSHRPEIELNIRYTTELRDIILVTVRNSCAENPFDKYGNLISTKESPAKHGYGIKSIERVVKKYNGNMSMYFDDETSTFHTNILFYKDFIPNWHNEHIALPSENVI